MMANHFEQQVASAIKRLTEENQKLQRQFTAQTIITKTLNERVTYLEMQMDMLKRGEPVPT